VRDAESINSVTSPDGPLWSATGDPLVVVDLDETPPSPLVLDVTQPVVVVGHARNPEDHDLDGVDVALTTAHASGRSWIQVEDLEEALTSVRTVVARNPLASVVVAQVLRATQSLGAAQSLLFESIAYGLLQGGPEHLQWRTTAPGGTLFQPDDEPDVIVERAGDELSLTFNRPRQRNAYRARTRDELVAGLEVALLDESISTVHLRGAGLTFGSGGDLREFGTVHDGATGHLIRSSRNAALLLSRLANRTTAHVHGPCYGAGVELAAACSNVIARPDTTFTLPEVAMGLIPGAGGTWSVPRRIGRHRATWMALSGEPVDAVRALDWGLIDELSDVGNDQH
jgi:enoyl-CoA hydratase/carnithine racemase